MSACPDFDLLMWQKFCTLFSEWPQHLGPSSVQSIIAVVVWGFQPRHNGVLMDPGETEVVEASITCLWNSRKVVVPFFQMWTQFTFALQGSWPTLMLYMGMNVGTKNIALAFSGMVPYRGEMAACFPLSSCLEWVALDFLSSKYNHLVWSKV